MSENYLRVRGEYPVILLSAPLIVELPPRARRIQVKYHGHIMDRGTTSACAENTASRIPKYHMTWNYLRVRGEYNPCSQKTGLCRELPPRARRILVLTIWLTRLIGTTSACAENTRGTVFCQVDGGTTSACAENTHPATHNNALSRNYLRVRGEYALDYLHGLLRTELPPRARRIRGFPAPRYQR